MPIRKMTSNIDVLQAAYRRMTNVFANGAKVYMSFSAGKDSLCMAHIAYTLIRQGKVDPKQLVVAFIDEEALYPSMEQMTYRWYKRFTDIGCEFRWYCLPFKQMSVLRHLQNEETWITWEPGKEDAWCRQPPPFAIMYHPTLEYPGQMTYQEFLSRTERDGIQLVGVRAAESYHRRKYMSESGMYSGGTIGGSFKVFPIYDWKDDDVWLYIKENNLDFPEAYMDMYANGTSRNRLRLCNYFGAEAVAGLKNIPETDPELWKRIEKREPNAYLVSLYWDSEMFRRQTRKRTELESDQDKKDYRAILEEMLIRNPQRYFTSPYIISLANSTRRFFLQHDYALDNDKCKQLYEMLLTGDPKKRTLRSIYARVYDNYAVQCRSEQRVRGGDGE